MKCLDDVIITKTSCLNNKCRHFIKYQDDLNCSHISIMKHGSLKLEEIGNRLHLTSARIKQIEEHILKKISKNKNILKILQ